jgi:hypothetical protein
MSHGPGGRGPAKKRLRLRVPFRCLSGLEKMLNTFLFWALMAMGSCFPCVDAKVLLDTQAPAGRQDSHVSQCAAGQARSPYRHNFANQRWKDATNWASIPYNIHQMPAMYYPTFKNVSLACDANLCHIATRFLA